MGRGGGGLQHERQRQLPRRCPVSLVRLAPRRSFCNVPRQLDGKTSPARLRARGR
eukprot:CAMPEP_0167794706 /NCGR_PEP_ID=MMETSP0111_2-20121227/13960_1 /TAXON_ID=91324 /ORGANISM="Lotharella globosa, Strain CCCM811" /LENGTH=54 /DNA_ID=CAMNT_0007688155 /DNA_START=605 /DNA_END=765 /DNA_ORIENTATION=+